MGRFFCRVCRVKGPGGSGAGEGDTADAGHHDSDANSDRTADLDGNGSASEAGEDTAPKKGRKKALETMAQMTDRVKRFVKVRSSSHLMVLVAESTYLDWRTPGKGRNHGIVKDNVYNVAIAWESSKSQEYED